MKKNKDNEDLMPNISEEQATAIQSEVDAAVDEWRDLNVPEVSDEQAAALGAKKSEDGKSLYWWTEEEEAAAKKDATAKSGEAQKSPSTSSNGSFVAVGGGGSSGTYGVVKNEDFTEYRKNRNAQIARQRAAVAAGKRAEQEERNRLLATGRYFNDGHGNIKLKKEYRAQNGDSRRGHFDKGTEHNTYADATNHAIKAAGQAAYNNAMDEGFEGALRRQNEERANRGRAKTQAIVEQNEFELAQQKKIKQEKAVNLAKGHLAIYDGLVAAYKAIDSEDGREETRKGQLKDKNGRVIGYGTETYKQVYADKDGVRNRVTTNGQNTRNGFVGMGTIDAINDSLRKAGNNKFKITGIIAQQNIDALGNKDGTPTFYIQGIRADGSSFGKTMTLQEVYNFGKENYVNTGVDGVDAEYNVINSLGDVFGFGAREEAKKMRDPKYRESVAKARSAEAEAKINEWKAENPEERAQSGGMSPERMELERKKIEQRQKEEEGRNARAKTKTEENVAKIATSVAKNLGDIGMNLNLSEEDSAKLTEGIKQIITDIVSKKSPPNTSDGKAEVKGGDNSDVKAPTIQTDGTLKMPGLSAPVKSGERFQMPNGKWYVWDGKGAANTNFTEVK